MKGRLFIGPAGAELIGATENGTPIVANDEGAGSMHEIKSFIDMTSWAFMGVRGEEGTE